MEGITGSMLLLCLLYLISLTNANTSPAIQTFVYSVCEDTPIGRVAFTIIATDTENDKLTYSLTGPNAGYFTVDNNTGRVSVARELDREGGGDLMPIGVVVSDGPNATPANLNLILLDDNDNKPIFQESSYDVNVPEDTTVGTSLFRVQASDRDSSNAGVIKYSIDEVTPSDGFSLFSIVNTTGEVKLSGRLNYIELSTFYRLKINATDGGGQCYYNETKYFSSVVFSFITVVDVPDLSPEFRGLPYLGKVEENSPVGTSVFRVTAIDRDTEVNDDIIYAIEKSTADGLFKISSDDGVISVQSAIDREDIGDTVTLTVTATESNLDIHGFHANTTANVQINIIDINDNKPQFYKCGGSGDELSCVEASHFTGEVFENSLGSVFINMTVKDRDRISTTELTLRGADKDVFSVEPQSTMSDSIVQLLVKQSQKLDFEEIQEMVLEVIATDKEEPIFQSTATVTITIKDTNDNSPVFPQDTYKLNVAEHSPVGTIVANITAEDPDTMDQGNITYRLLPDSILLYFDVEPHTGSIYVKNETLLDREARSLYSATLQARDTDGKPSTTLLEITVTDINDQHPVMNRDSYVEFVEEGGHLDLKIEATDADDSATVNSQIVFGIVPSRYSNNFTINPNTGVLTNNGELDREALDPNLGGKIELNITATDKGSPPLSTMVTVIINVEDVNDNTPQFEASSYEFSVKEGEKGAFVGSVYAEDLDQTTAYSRISFSIINGSFGSFIIRTFAEGRGYRGNITVDPDIELDYESARKQFKLQVEATDLEKEKAVVMVKVNVADVNDERPEFKLIASVTVKENTNISGAVGSFTGWDKDGNHSLVYELESIKCRCNSSLTHCSSFILDPTGEVRVNPEELVDYEHCDQVVIEAQVVDEFTEKGENNSVTTGEMVINIEDINDNAPEFIFSDSVFVVVSESASKGTSVAAVTATDLDSGINREIEFKVTAVQFEDTNNHTSNMRMLFEAVTTQQKDIYVGIIQTTEGLDMTLKGKYLVTVTATDAGDLSTSTVLEIFTVDESYKVELEFTSSEDEVEKNLNEILKALTAATKAAVEIVAIRSDTARASRASSNTIIVAYFVYSNGTALTSNEVEKMLSDPEHYLALGQLGLKNIGKAPVNEPDADPVQYILLGMVGGLIIVLAVLTISLMCTRRNYRRKLKAAKAMNSASMVTSENQKSGPVVPGTNKYTMEGANPVLNLNINTTMVLDVDEESSDVDKVSLNSLDYSDDMTLPEKDSQPIMQMIQEEEEEEDGGPPEYIEPLGAALAQRGQKKGSDNPRVGISNPVFSTTDL
ncbi:cadherin-related family member 2 [Enoplosus armatus]|uniref:cadherin-related family member 2 n=1 Tax=Enoplosus armatus TaxID=215367 RepID=UPI003995A680